MEREVHDGPLVVRVVREDGEERGEVPLPLLGLVSAVLVFDPRAGVLNVVPADGQADFVEPPDPLPPHPQADEPLTPEHRGDVAVLVAEVGVEEPHLRGVVLRLIGYLVEIHVGVEHVVRVNPKAPIVPLGDERPVLIPSAVEVLRAQRLVGLILQ